WPKSVRFLFCSGTMDHNLEIPLHESSLNIVKQSRSALSHILDSKFGCVVTFEGVDFESDVSFGQQKRQTVVPEKRFSVKLPAGVEVSVWKADLTDFKVDAVVNAANSFLQHGAGLAQALCEAGGPQIQMESKDYIFKHGSLLTGEAIVTNAGSLPCRKIIHAVGPQLSPNPSYPEVSHAEPFLKTTITSILQKATQYRLDSVAIPAISSGLFSYPLSDCAKTIAVADFAQTAQRKMDVYFVIFPSDRDTFQVVFCVFPSCLSSLDYCRVYISPVFPLFSVASLTSPAL
uniref:Macro domain-containing protein n=1 Tax=Oreochromis niloticus TaxID=8128 RepID=A0A669BI64_ORENI